MTHEPAQSKSYITWAREKREASPLATRLQNAINHVQQQRMSVPDELRQAVETEAERAELVGSARDEYIICRLAEMLAAAIDTRRKADAEAAWLRERLRECLGSMKEEHR